MPQSTERLTPQLSRALSAPQDCPRREQNEAFVSETQPLTPQMFLIPPMLQEALPAQLPQLTVRGTPQLSRVETGPHVLPSRKQKTESFSGWQQLSMGPTQLPCQHTRSGPQVWPASPHGSPIKAPCGARPTSSGSGAC